MSFARLFFAFGVLTWATLLVDTVPGMEIPMGAGILISISAIAYSWMGCES